MTSGSVTILAAASRIWLRVLSNVRAQQVEMRILVVFEDDYRTYREVLAVGIRLLRPRAEVETASLEELGERIERFDPDLVICGGCEAVDSGGRPAWVELSV